MGRMSQGGVNVGMMSHKCGKNESGWSKCEKEGKESMRIVTGCHNSGAAGSINQPGLRARGVGECC